MRIFLDESYDLRTRYMCLGVLFIPENGMTNSHLEVIKDKYRRMAPGRSFSDVKYTKSGENFTFEVCREILDLFASQTGVVSRSGHRHFVAGFFLGRFWRTGYTERVS